jgi:hypothetical protein
MICSLEKKYDWFVHVSDVLERLKLCFWFPQKRDRERIVYKQIIESFWNISTRIEIYFNDRVSIRHNTYACVSLNSIFLMMREGKRPHSSLFIRHGKKNEMSNWLVHIRKKRLLLLLFLYFNSNNEYRSSGKTTR